MRSISIPILCGTQTSGGCFEGRTVQKGQSWRTKEIQCPCITQLDCNEAPDIKFWSKKVLTKYCLVRGRNWSSGVLNRLTILVDIPHYLCTMDNHVGLDIITLYRGIELRESNAWRQFKSEIVKNRAWDTDTADLKPDLPSTSCLASGYSSLYIPTCRNLGRDFRRMYILPFLYTP